MGGYQRVAGSGQVLERGAEPFQVPVAHGDGDVAQETRVTCARDGRAAKHRAELVLGYGGQFLEWRRELPRLEGPVGGGRGAPVPRAHILADVASKNVAARSRPVLSRHSAAQLDRQVR